MITLPPLPYAKNALEPYISERTLDFHYGKHHQAYVTNLNILIDGTDLSKLSLEEIIKSSHGNADKQGIFNNAAQVWNHTFYWHSLTPTPKTTPSPHLLKQIEKNFGTLENFKDTFKKTAVSQFGSGWAWLVSDQSGSLQIIKTSNAETPLTNPSLMPLLTCDVWEHAYYLDYQNRRPDYVDTCLMHLLNWDFAEENFDKSQKGHPKGCC